MIIQTTALQTVLKIVLDEEWQKESLSKVAAAFEENHPQVSVELQCVPNLRDKILSGEIEADIIQMYNTDFIRFLEKGIVSDLSK